MIHVLVIVLLTLGVGVFIMSPLLMGSSRRISRTVEMEDLLLRRDQLFHEIRELEFDYRVGKLSEEDYADLLAQLKAEAAEVIAQINARGGVPRRTARARAGRRAGPTPEEIEARVEAAKRKISRASE